MHREAVGLDVLLAGLIQTSVRKRTSLGQMDWSHAAWQCSGRAAARPISSIIITTRNHRCIVTQSSTTINHVLQFVPAQNNHSTSTNVVVVYPQVPYDLGDIAKQQRKPFLQGEYGGFSSGMLLLVECLRKPY